MTPRTYLHVGGFGLSAEDGEGGAERMVRGVCAEDGEGGAEDGGEVGAEDGEVGSCVMCRGGMHARASTCLYTRDFFCRCIELAST